MMRTLMACVAAAALALPAAAQQHQHQHEGQPSAERPAPRGSGMRMEGQGGMMPLMREVHAFRPQSLIERRVVLGLTDAQVERLTRLGEEAQAAHEGAHTEAEARMAEARTAWDAGNVQDANAALQAGMRAMQAAHLAMLSAAGEARAVLTEAQRGRIQGWMDAASMRQGRRPMRPGRGPRGGLRR